MKKKLLYLLYMGTKLTLYGAIIQCLLFSLVLASNSEAQKLKSVNDVEIEIGFRNNNLIEVFTQIEAMTDFNFSYFKRDLNQKQKLNIPVSKLTLGELLLKISEETGLAFKQVNNTITVKVSKHNLPEANSLEIFIQNKTITGKVVSREGNEPLPGVNIVEKGTTNGTISDVDGNYSIEVAENAILVFSSVGYASEEVNVANRSVINIALSIDVKALEEIVVVGYGEQRRVTITGSISSVKGEDVVKSPTTNVSNSLVGRLPGLVSVTRSGEPGYDQSDIRIRGLNTLNDNSPLVVVDGVPGRSLDRLDPASIETITVLKDASAAIYGARAANGVILVTTKRGEPGKPVISINYNQGFSQPTRTPKMASSAEYATMLNEIDMYNNNTPRYSADEIEKFRDGSDPWRYPNTDWFKEVHKPWSAQNYANASISGGSENMQYFLLLSGKSQDGYFYNSGTKYNQYDFRSNIDGQVNRNITIGFDVAGRMEDRNFPARGAGDIYRMVMRGKPTMPAYWPNGTPGPDIEYGDNPAVISTNATGYDHDKVYVLQSNLRLGINIPWVKGLSVHTNANFDKDFKYRKRFQTPWYLYSWDGQTMDDNNEPLLVRGQRGFEEPRLQQWSHDRQTILLNARVDYERSFGDHYMKFMVGTESVKENGEDFWAFRRKFVSTAVDQLFAGGDDEKDNSGTGYERARLHYFGRINYNYLERYMVEFVWRNDGSYNFPKEGRYGFFPGVSVGWRVSEESFFNGVSFVDNLKLRGSWGQTGNDRIDEWQFVSAFEFNEDNYTYVFGVDKENKRLSEDVPPNPFITWEVSDQFNVGFEMDFFSNKFYIEADYFNNTRRDILIRPRSIPESAGIIDPPFTNIGKVANRGFDFNVGHRKNTGALTYDISFNGGYAKNKILFWDEAEGAPDWQRFTGHPMPIDPQNPNDNLYYQATGIFKDQGDLDAYPHWNGARPGDVIFKDVDENGVIDGNDRVRSNYNTVPRFTTGLSTNFKYKNFDLSILFQGATGAIRYIDTESGEMGNYLKDFYDNRWTPDNIDASYPRTFNRSNEYWKSNRNDFWLRKTDYVRLKNLEFGYNLPQQLIERLGIQNLRVYVSGFNLLTYSPDLKDFDPEADNQAGTNYPVQRVVNAGLSFSF